MTQSKLGNVKRIRITLTLKQFEQIKQIVKEGDLGNNPSNVAQKIIILYLSKRFGTAF